MAIQLNIALNPDKNISSAKFEVSNDNGNNWLLLKQITTGDKDNDNVTDSIQVEGTKKYRVVAEDYDGQSHITNTLTITKQEPKYGKLVLVHLSLIHI